MPLPADRSAIPLSRRLLASLLAVCLVLQPAAAQLPELGDPSQAALPPAKEKRIGEMIMRDIRQNDPAWLDDAEIEHYLGALGGRLVIASGARPEDFRFFAMREPSINAFAMPGGYIGVHTGLFLAAQNESELAGVLAHEIGHVSQRHIARMLDRQSNANTALLAALVIAVLAGGRGSSGAAIAEATVAGTHAALIQNQLNYSQDYEREADRIGFQTLAAAGFDVQGMADFFDRLGKTMRHAERAETAYLRTHPMSGERMADMQGRVHAMVRNKVENSREFTLLRARIDADMGLPADALRRIQSRSAGSVADEAARHYALTRVHLRNLDPAAATASLARLRALNFDSPLIDSLAADIAFARQQPAEAASLCARGLQQHPGTSYLLLCQMRGLIDSGQGHQAAQRLRDALVDAPGNERLLTLLARAYAQQGNTVEQQRALAELYVAQGRLGEAVEQLSLAQRSGAGDYHTQSGIDARLRELRQRLLEERRDARANGLQ